jgi:hypothetical protein
MITRKHKRNLPDGKGFNKEDTMNHLLRRRSVFVSAILIAAIIFALVPGKVALAADFSVITYAALVSAITTANSNGQPDIITLGGDILLEGALPQITSEILIEGAEFSIDGAGAYRVLDIGSGGVVTINNLTVENGLTTSGGGGGILNAGTLTLVECVISNNQTTNGGGGGIRNETTGVLTIKHSTISGNESSYAPSGGDSFGGGLSNNGSATISHSTISDNTVSSVYANTLKNGGGIRNNGTMTINNSTIFGNVSGPSNGGFGGGVMNVATRTITINNTTIANNASASGRGGGIRNDGVLNFSRTLVADNSTGGDCTMGGGGSIGINDSNLVEVDSVCPALYDGDPALPIALTNEGGPTLVLALLPGSLALDKVANGYSTDGVDQRGAARDYDSDPLDLNTNSLGDIGAFEYRAPTQDCTTTNGTEITIENVTMVFTGWSAGCVTVEEMGPGTDHLEATGTDGTNLRTDNWWHISGDGSLAFTDVTITLPYVNADEGTTVCQWPGGFRGEGWFCLSTDFVEGVSVTRSGITTFSDWAVGQDVGPTAVGLTTLNTQSSAMLPVIFSVLAAIALLGLLLVVRKGFRVRA